MAFCEPLGKAVSYLFSMNLYRDWELSYEERLGSLPYDLSAVSSKLVIAIDYYYFCISSHLVQGNIDRYRISVFGNCMEVYCSKEVTNGSSKR